ncbi:uncharacterized protein LOC112023681 isoform X4 [Quercus suber]|uniref:uncharacterized protein LOC112023681 isoform X4 n=1 Tax=Quercus suber TaxID=58331 RepID=UPI0032DF08F7
MVLCTTDDYRMLKIHVLCNYSLSLHFWLRQSGELGTVMCLDKTSHARETGSRNILPSFWPDIMQNVAFPWASDIVSKFLTTKLRYHFKDAAKAILTSNAGVL